MAFSLPKGGTGAIIGGALGGPVGAAAGAYIDKTGKGQKLGNILTGTSKDAGILGVGQYKGNIYNPDGSAFQGNPALQKSFAQQLAASQNQKAPTVQAAQLTNNAMAHAATINGAKDNQARLDQRSLTQQLQDQAMGKGPSLAQNQLREGTDRNIAQAMALQASARGATPGQGLRQIAQTTANANQQAAQQSADLRLQEQQGAQGQLAGVLNQTRGADQSLASNQASLTQQAALANQAAQNQFKVQQGEFNQAANLANQSAQAQQNQQKNAMAQYYNTGLANMSDADRQALIAQQQLIANQNVGIAGVNANAYNNASQARSDLMGGIATGIMASGEELKTNIKPIDSTPATAEEPAKSGGVVKSIVSSIAKQPAQDAAKPAEPHGTSAEGKGIGMGLGKLFGSDEEMKKDVEGGGNKLKDFLNSIKAYQYEYKDKKFGDGTYISPMAQDLEKTDIGDGLVTDTPEGKMVNYGRAGGLMLATASMLNDRVEKLERALKAKKRA